MADGLKYVGRGEFLPGVPARDLSAEELLAMPAEERVRIDRCGLWVGELPRPLCDIDGIGAEIRGALAAVGIETVEQLRHADDRALLAISGIGAKRLADIRAAVGGK
jgi:hypothetical protein